MTNITHKQVASKEFIRIEREFLKLMRGTSHKAFADCFTALCTESERIMLLKRFGALLLYSQNSSPYKVAQKMGLSVSTAQRLQAHYLHGRYTPIFQTVSEKRQNSFVRFMLTLTAAQVDPKARAKIARGTW
ncbi:MAG TPA: hypothetical protein VKP88_02375 [Candidatus Paceibacterota bacterium]|nr:hypothetical protein [Candidatus Paceibacterota bacterium]